MSISKEDVLHVAEYMRMKPAEEQIQYCIDEFDRQANSDPTGNWQTWIEDLLFEQDVESLPKPEKKIKHFLFDMTTGQVQLDLGEITPSEAESYESNSLRAITEHQLLVERAIVQIRQDVAAGDVTAIEGLLQVIPIQTLRDFLPEGDNVFKDFGGFYSSVHDFIERNSLKKIAEKLFGEFWEAEDDVKQIQELLSTFDDYTVTTIDVNTERDARADDYIKVTRD